MNILFVNDIPFNPQYGGIERVTDILTKELITKHHYSIFYLCGNTKNKEICNYDFPAPIYYLPQDGFFSNKDNISFYKALILELGINIIINQRGNGNFMDDVLMTGSQAKSISVLHSRIDSTIIGFFTHRKESPIWDIKNIVKRSIYPIYKYIKTKQLYKNLLEHYKNIAIKSTAIVVLSDNYAKELNRITHHLSPRIVTIPNPNTYKEEEHIDSLKKENIILYVGRLDNMEKAPIRLLEIWKRIHHDFQDWKVVFVGDGASKSQMLKYIYKYRLPRVEFAGMQKDVRRFYRKASFVCLTSNYEGWGMSLTEGMQHGCIPFTFNNYGAASDIIDDNVNGCLIPAFDLKEYASRLSELMHNDVKRAEMGKAAIEKVKIFSIMNIAEKWNALFHSL